VKDLVELLRPVNCLMAGGASVVGLLLAAPGLGGDLLLNALAVFLAAFIITGAGNAVNDYFDRAIDAVNRPKRPIPSGRVSPGAALLFSILLFSAGCGCAGLVSSLCLAVAASNSALLYFYARSLKATPLAGNLCVGYLTGSTFLFGGAAYGADGVRAVLAPALLAALATVSREIVKDIEDVEGDRAGGAMTLPILAGRRVSSLLASAYALAAAGLSYIPRLGTAYIVIVAVADILFLISVWRIFKGEASGAQRALKQAMAVALLAFLAGAVASHLCA
jgi:geranylgeranylglycerol-phosphate geranylgeranyltransferase